MERLFRLMMARVVMIVTDLLHLILLQIHDFA